MGATLLLIHTRALDDSASVLLVPALALVGNRS